MVHMLHIGLISYHYDSKYQKHLNIMGLFFIDNFIFLVKKFFSQFLEVTFREKFRSRAKTFLRNQRIFIKNLLKWYLNYVF